MHPGAQQEGQTYCVPFHTPAQVPRLALITCPLHWGAPFLPLGLPEQCFLHCLLLLLTGQPTAPPVCIAPSCSSLLEIFWLFLLVCNTSELSVKGPRPRKKPDGIFIGITLYINSGTQTVTMPSQADTRWLSISSLCVFRVSLRETPTGSRPSTPTLLAWPGFAHQMGHTTQTVKPALPEVHRPWDRRDNLSVRGIFMTTAHCAPTAPSNSTRVSHPHGTTTPSRDSARGSGGQRRLPRKHCAQWALSKYLK